MKALYTLLILLVPFMAICQSSIMDVVANSPAHTILEQAINAAELNETLDTGGPFTLFAPSDDAFAALPEGTVEYLLADLPQLTEVLLHHVLAGTTMAEDLNDGDVLTTLNNDNLTVSVDGMTCMIDMATVTAANLEADNGVVHLIDMVLIPETNNETVMSIIEASPVHDILEAAINAAGLAETLSGEGPFTVFAPSDDAFAALPEGTVEYLLADLPQLTEVLLHHVLAGTTMAEDLNDGDVLTTLNNDNLTVSVDGMTCMIDMATVTAANLEADNGVVHLIDMVLLTSSFIDASWFCGLDGCEESMDNSGDYFSYEECFEQGCTLNTGEDCSELFISEYVEGSSNNKAIEIYNPTQFSIDLSNYKVVRYTNGSNFISDEMILSGTINPYSTWVITNSDTNTTNEFGYIEIELYNMADQLAPEYPSPLYMNGNDAIGLTKNGVLIDLIGKIGEDPGDAWTDDVTAGFTDANGGAWWTKNHTLVRKGSVKNGMNYSPIIFNPTAEWDSLPNNTWTELGFHECECNLICEDVTTYIDTTVCDNFNWNGNNFSQSGSDSYTYLYVINDNCDSTVTVDFTINQSSYTNLYVDTCESFEWNGDIYNESGTYTYLTTNTVGCDSISTLYLNVYNEINENNIVGNPNPDPYTVYIYSVNENGNLYNWTVAGGSIIENNGNFISIQWGEQGEGLITLTEFNDACESYINELNVTIGNDILNSWNCVNDACVDPMDGTGVYDDINECEAVCNVVIAESWNCVNEACVDPMDGTGVYDDINECEAVCNVVIAESWNCVNEACVDPMDGSGIYSSLNDCEANCTVIIEDSWNCVNEACVDPMDGTGVYDNINECEAVCNVVIAESWNCVNEACVDPMDGTGVYDDINECEAVCDVTSINENDNEVNIYPNPSSNIFNLEFNLDSKSEIIVTNVLGEQVYIESNQSIGEYNTQIDLSNYSKGIYNLTIKTSDGISNHKLILQ